MLNTPKTPTTLLAEALAEIASLRKELAGATRAAVRGVLDELYCEGAEFHYNDFNDYGSVELTLQTGAGNPWDLYRGSEIQGNYVDGIRGTGFYHLNDAAVDMLVERLKSKAAKG